MSDLLQQAIAEHQARHIAQAEELYRLHLKSNPKSADGLALLGVLLDDKGDSSNAIDYIHQAIKLDTQSALFKLYLGNALLNAQRVQEAIVAYQQAITLQPKLSEAHFNLGNALRRVEDWSGAIRSYRQSIELKPSNVDAYNNLALALVHEKQYDEALEQSKIATSLGPQHGASWLTLCNIAEQCKNFELALKAGEQNVRLLPDNHRAWFGYGVALNRLDHNEEAIVAYKKALELKPDRADIWDNLGQTYQSLNRLEDAEAAFRKTLEVAGQVIPDEGKDTPEEKYGSRHWHLSLLELLRGNYTSGFSRYRSRFEDVGGLVRPKFSRPLWKGEDLKGKSILIWDEQGFGDTIMLSRYLPLLKERGARILFSVHPVLKPLFENWNILDGLVVHGSPVSGFDYHASVFDLPHLFRTTLETIPSTIPYLPTPAATAEANLGKSDVRKIGVVWGGSPLHLNDGRRSVPLKIFSNLFKNSNFAFYSLNRDLKPGDKELLATCPIIDLVPKIKDFADGARYIDQLDLVITCDTATAHLAGALGKPVWIMLPFAPDWRWLTERKDSPWYPTARLFRQKTISNWENVVEDIQQALLAWKA